MNIEANNEKNVKLSGENFGSSSVGRDALRRHFCGARRQCQITY
jgi:hypothetical protein